MIAFVQLHLYVFFHFTPKTRLTSLYLINMSDIVKVSYHGGHSGDLCAHASDTKEAMIQAYIEAGFSHIGIVEHLPPATDEFMYADELELGHTANSLTERFTSFFKNDAPTLRKKYSKKYGKKYGNSIDLRIGFETEYYGDTPIKHILNAIETYKPDIVIASLHHAKNLSFDFDKDTYFKSAELLGGLDELHKTYYDEQLQLIHGLAEVTKHIPVVLGHMDVIRLYAPEHQYNQEVADKISRNILAAIQANFVFEVNSRALGKNMTEPYPSLRILQEIKDLGGSITLGDDAHAINEPAMYYPECQPMIKEIFEEITVFEDSDTGYIRKTLVL